MLRTLAVCAAFLALPHVAWAEESAGSWREDLAIFQRELPRTHKNLFHSMTREEFDAAVTGLAARIGELDDDSIVTALARIVARVGDGHTHIDFTDPALGFHVLPMRLSIYPDGLYVDAAALGWRMRWRSSGGTRLRIRRPPNRTTASPRSC